MKYVQNNSSIVRLERNVQEIMKYRTGENIRFIINSCIGGNDLAYYIFSRLNLSYSGSDAQEIEMLRKQYEQKIDEYLKRLEEIENNRANAKKSSEIYEDEERDLV